MSLAIFFNEIWVISPKCDNCKRVFQNYNESLSAYSEELLESCTYSHEFKRLFLSGDRYHDQLDFNGLQLNASICVANSFTDPLNFAEDGIIGLGNDSTSIVYSMYLNGVIDKPIYSIHSLSLNASNLLFGSIDFKHLNLTMGKQVVLSYNQGLVAKFKYKEIIYEEYPIEISSLYSYIAGPYETLHHFYESLVQDYGCYNFMEFIICKCQGNYPDIHFIIQSFTLTIQSSNYFKTVYDM